jgi:MobA/MobL family
MAIFHLTVKTHGFGNDPKLNALRSYAYRAGTKIVDPVTGSIYNYLSKQSEVVLTETITPTEFIPDWMKDGVQLWRSLQTLEEGGRVDAQIFREIEMSLPIELGIDEWKTIIHRFIREQLTSKGIIASFSVHLKVGNPHVHVMTTLRDIEGGMFLKKNRDWSRVSFVHELRESWSRHVNEALEAAGLDVRITHKSFANLGIEREASVHVGPVHLGKRNEAYQAKREARKQHNDRARVINSQRGKRRRHHARSYLTTGACAAKLGASLRNHPDDVPLSIPSTLSSPSTLSPVDQAAYDAMHAALPDADRIYLEMGRVKRGLGREWNWPSFLAQYKRLDKSGDILDALLAKEMIWVVSRTPELAPEFVTLVAPQRLAKAVRKAFAWAQAAMPDRLPMLDDMMVSATRAMAESSPGSEMDAETDLYADALARLEYLVTNRAELVRQCQRVAHAIDRPLSPEVMAKRISRVVGSTKSPENQADLLDALITMEVVFAAKRRPHRVTEVLNAAPIERRAHFEGVIASVLGTLPVDAGHDIAARALPHQIQMDMQAEFNVRQVLSEFQCTSLDFI